KDLLDRIEVWRVLRQEEQLGAGRADELAHGIALVAAEIVHDDDICGPQGRKEDVLDVDSKALSVDWAIDHPWSFNPVVAKSGQERGGPPAAMRDLRVEPHAAVRPAPQRCHVGLGPGLVDEDEARGLNPALIFRPLRPPAGDVRTIALAGGDAFFEAE